MKKHKTLLSILVLLFAMHNGFSQSTSEFFSKANTFFAKNVKKGRVNYAAIKADPSELNDLISMAEGISVSKSDVKNYQAFWINGYNLHVINGIIEKYPVKGPTSIGGFFDGKKRKIGGKSITLNDIENKLLRGNFPDEPRFHFALVCAGLGCPPIINKAYLPETLDAQLERQTKFSLNNPYFIRTKGGKILLSQIFEWYKEDFKKKGQNELQFINKYRKEKLDENAKFGYYNYNWALNDFK